MATILLSAAGAAIGSSVGGSVLGLSATAIGRFAGAALGRSIDTRLLGAGSAPVETGRLDRYRITGAGEGDPIPRLFGRMRVGGQVIWASRFRESVSESGGGKGAPTSPRTRAYGYSVSLAIALCEGEISGIGRVWADGKEVAPDMLNLRVHTGAADQLPDATMEAVEGAGQVPAYRGVAYVVLEDLPLESFGNRVPQFNFEVLRPAPLALAGAEFEPAHAIRGVALMPGSGEYALASTPVHYDQGAGVVSVANVNSPSDKADLLTSLDQLEASLPNCAATSLIVSWFGNDLRCGNCEIRPKVEQRELDGAEMPWTVAGVARAEAELVAMAQDRPVYGATPADMSVIQSIRALRDAGQAVMFYPFVLMDQLPGNALPDPHSEAEDQPQLPWRGRITLSEAPGRAGSPDGTAQAAAEVAAFFGTAQASDFDVETDRVTYSGPEEWRFRRFILHCAALARAAGGVDSFCIGSEMVGLTTIRGVDHSFPAVAALRDLAGEVRAILGPDCKIGYAADWTEYSGYQPPDAPGDRYFHLDPLWSDPQIDFIGIDNYLPLSDWRDGEDHADADYESIYNPLYLQGNIEGGELYDWYYASAGARAAQIRTPITDGAHGEPWIWRVKDIRNWWGQLHHERIDGLRRADPTGWLPRSKPIWFTELGCAAIDKGTNQPNKFLDPKSSESAMPYFSTGRRDDLIQMEYLRAMHEYWSDPVHNPASDLYEGRMLDMSRAFVWAWDARPFPWFPGNDALWSDGPNYRAGHWITGRASGRSLALLVAEICTAAGLTRYDVSGLHGYVSGYLAEDTVSARERLQPLMTRYAFDAVERDGLVRFVMRGGPVAAEVTEAQVALSPDLDARIEKTREPEAELSGRLRLKFVEADADFDVIAEEAILPDMDSGAVAGSQMALAMPRGTGREVLERWLSEARVSRDRLRLTLPPSRRALGAGDVMRVVDSGGTAGLYRIDRVEHGLGSLVEAVRIAPRIYGPPDLREVPGPGRNYTPPSPVFPLFLDLPLMRGDEVPHAPHVAVTAEPWPGAAALYHAAGDAGYALDRRIGARATLGVTLNALPRARVGLTDPGPALRVRLTSGTLASVDRAALLSGANLMAIGSGDPGGWELFQFGTADLVAPGVYDLSQRLRGQQGSGAAMPDNWPAGSYVVAMNGVPEQIGLAPQARGVTRHYRVGPAAKPPDDPSYSHHALAFAGVGLRPWRPCHLRAEFEGDDTLRLRWIRQTRVDGDGWDQPEVPLGEETERYQVEVYHANTLKRQEIVTASDWTYPLAARLSDGVSGLVELRVAQVSASFGAGDFARLITAS
ncbi:baseplate multidomain protein megatron [Pseudooceanicola aestuarii]|uniref:baseplate multidomain protein megatron n=1 Tax=Pseudooceanicola aestuarii TaxID=2697319 RepID=UPI0013D54F8F|nr:glycoside hydrolase TIM-barrel-like domain-containing protein [Pseudooceanicola aestuarii]